MHNDRIQAVGGLLGALRVGASPAVELAGGSLLAVVDFVMLATRKLLFERLNGIYFGVELDRHSGRGRLVYAVAYLLIPLVFLFGGLAGVALALS